MGMFDDLIPQGVGKPAGSGTVDDLIPGASTLSDVNTGIAQGLTLGFKDELFSGIAAPFRAGARAIVGGDEGKSFAQRLSDAYSTELETQRQILKRAQERSPVATGVGEVAGALLLPIPGGAATTLPRTAFRSAGIGAGVGGAFGFGTGEGTQDRLTGASIGAASGGAAGGVLPFIGSGLSLAGRAINQGVIEPLRGALNVENAAGRQVRNALAADAALIANPQQRVQDLAAAEHRGQPVANIDLGGERTRSLARSSADLSPEGRDALNQVIDTRFESQGGRIGGFLRSLVPGADRGVAREALEAQAARANRPAYANLYRQGDRPIESDELNRLAGSQIISTAIQRVVSGRGRDRAIAQGFGSFNPPFRVTPDGRIERLRNPRTGFPAFPNIQFWDFVKREADSLARQAQRSGADAGADFQIIRQLRDELDRIVPGYRQVREGAATFFGAEDALEAGANFARRNFDLREAQRAFARFSAPERELAAQGFTSEILGVAGRSNFRADLVRQIWGSPDNRNKFRLILGPQRARQFEAFMNIEALFNAPRNAVQGNSRTAQYLASIGLSSTITGAFTGDFQSAVIAGVLGGGVRLGLRGVDRRVAQRIGEMLASDDPRVFMQGLNRIAGNPSLMGRLRQAIAAMGSGRAAAISGQQSVELAQ